MSVMMFKDSGLRWADMIKVRSTVDASASWFHDHQGARARPPTSDPCQKKVFGPGDFPLRTLTSLANLGCEGSIRQSRRYRERLLLNV